MDKSVLVPGLHHMLYHIQTIALGLINPSNVLYYVLFLFIKQKKQNSNIVWTFDTQ